MKDISFTNLKRMEINGEFHRLRDVTQQSITSQLGIPIQYLRKCPEDLQRENIRYWLQREKNEQLFFRFDGNDVRAIFTPRYIPTDNPEVLEKLKTMEYPFDNPVQCSLNKEFMMLNIPDTDRMFSVNGDRMKPGISISNSEVELAALSVAAFVPRPVCMNGIISKTEVTASNRHVSMKILQEFPSVLSNVSQDLGRQKDYLRLSLEIRVENQEATINSFNRQFNLGKEEKEAVEWAIPCSIW